MTIETFRENLVRRRDWVALTAVLLAAAAPHRAGADQVMAGGMNQINAKVTGLSQGRLEFRAADGRTLAVPMDQIQLLQVDRGGVYDDFNQAERFLHEGEALKAIARYERTLRLTQEFWPELIASRMSVAYDRAGQIDRTVVFYLRVVNGTYSGPAAAARMMPKNLPGRRDGRTVRALDILAEESRRTGDELRRSVLDALRYDILSRVDAEGARGLARTIAEMSVAAPLRTERMYGIVLSAMRLVSQDSPDAFNLTALDRAIRDCPEAVLPGFLMLKGAVQLHRAQSREDLIHAAWSFMRVPVHMPDDELAPKALLEAARILERLGRSEQARLLRVECRKHPRATDEIRKQADFPLEPDSLPQRK